MAYDQSLPLREDAVLPDQVVLPRKQHVGAPAVPVVTAEQSVNRGDLVAEIPDGQLGARLYASIDGKVAAVTAENIIITRDPKKEVADHA